MDRDWRARFADLLGAWTELADLTPEPAASGWESARSSMELRQRELEAAGVWQTGPADLLSIVGLHRWELAHSAALAWLLDPRARHGLGGQVLNLFLEAGNLRPVDRRVVAVEVEVTRAESRADVVVVGVDWHLVVEVKVDAIEGDQQLQRLWNDWALEPQVGFVFLTRSGHRGRTAVTPECQEAWSALSWSSLAKDLERLLAQSNQDHPAQGALEQYVQTLNRVFGGRR